MLYTISQPGKTIGAALRGFGWSLYGNEDIDDNGYPGRLEIYVTQLTSLPWLILFLMTNFRLFQTERVGT